MRLLLSYLKEHRLLILATVGLGTINQVFSLLDPQIFRLIVDNYATKASEFTSNQFFTGVGLLLLASIGVAFISRVAKNFQDYCTNLISQRVGAKLYQDSIHHAFSLPYRSFEDQSSGELLQKLQKARLDTQQLLALFSNLVLVSLVGTIFIVIYAFYVHTLIGLVYLAIIPVMAVILYWLTRRIKKTQKEIVLKTSLLAGTTTETLRNVELVKSLGLEEQEAIRLNQANEAILNLELDKIRMIRVLSFIQGTLVNACYAAGLFMMMWLIFKNEITFGEFFSLYIYLFFIFNPLQQLSEVATRYQETSASLEKLDDVLKQEPETKPTDAKVIGLLEKIEFNNVSFSYNETDSSLKNINFVINKGETVALAGPSGSGKSTLVKLLAGLYQPDQGEIKLNDLSNKEVDIDAFRRRIGYVSQETQLFAGTIGENLRFVRPNATDAECYAALKAAAVDKIIERGDEGLNTRIGEGGIKLSGGERQRLAIARALLREPDLIIFDEATSSLDSLTEKEITDTIKHISSQRPELTTVMIAHRLSTISHADTIYVLEAGELVEQGSHEALLSQAGLYAALWREQGHK
ncbi:MAG: ABC transporter ATP-binding protein [Candidatus Pacebacteria bacterium]|nr:ABC transporter ATP-binding protein [Candidatus Paceibacterota bacterium]